MSNMMLHFVQPFALIMVIVFALFSYNVITNARTSRKFVLKGFVQQQEQKEEIEVQNITFLGRLTSFKKYKAYITRELEDARMKQSFAQFTAKRLVIGLSLGFVVLVGYYISDISLYLYLAIPAAFLGYKLPKNEIKKSKMFYEQQMKIELPDYLSAFGVLLEKNTPYEATRKSIDYAGDLLKPFVQDLITQIDLYPASNKPYEDFAEAVGIREAKEFIIMLNQMNKVSAADSKRIIGNQLRVMDALQEETYNEQIEDRPDEVQKYIMPMIFPLVSIIFTFVFVMLSNTFSQI
ncbi:hypothetical protein [Terribacillus saccharophilus]|uniref:hypothetical protein n=1 Tax=Terribacillus saccharophilus TaxID=361277 RepID=UPI002989A283|nr:hypothetical protein [Terribacillus saccharophilus]MCM3227706.1 hypothetical protein [Terribacillus saccharophilus]